MSTNVQDLLCILQPYKGVNGQHAQCEKLFLMYVNANDITRIIVMSLTKSLVTDVWRVSKKMQENEC